MALHSASDSDLVLVTAGPGLNSSRRRQAGCGPWPASIGTDLFLNSCGAAERNRVAFIT